MLTYQAKIIYKEDPTDLEKELNDFLRHLSGIYTVKEIKTDVGTANNKIMYFASVLYSSPMR